MKNIALLTGGFSSEDEVSYKTTANIYKNLNKEKWHVYIVTIHENSWHYTDAATNQNFEIDKNDFSLSLPAGKILFDAVFCSIHGTPGEDGKILGYFDCLHIPYTSCGATSSALTFNKQFTVGLASQIGINTAKSVVAYRNDASIDEQSRYFLSALRLPFFVKPNNGGSSYGITLVHTPDQVPDALQKAFKEDDEVMGEELIKGREFTVGVYKHKNQVYTLPITEIIPKNAYFDYEAKYLGASQEVTPASVTQQEGDQLTQAATNIFKYLNCKGVVRIDFIYDDKQKRPYLLEVNTVPGQTEQSILPQQIAAAGINISTFYDWLLEDCIEQNQNS